MFVYLRTWSVFTKVLSGMLVAFPPKRPRVTGWKEASDVPFLNFNVMNGSVELPPEPLSELEP